MGVGPRAEDAAAAAGGRKTMGRRLVAGQRGFAVVGPADAAVDATVLRGSALLGCAIVG